MLTRKQKRNFQKTVYDYYKKHGRHNLPWRKTRDPYRIFVSEIMLQQTQVPRVIEKYKSFITRFPALLKLSNASLRDVLKEWSGLGYNRRALMLQKAAQEIISKYKGTVPQEIEELRSLPGIGKTTACEIRSFAYNLPSVFIETNIRAVFIHFFFRGKENVHDEDVLPLVEQTADIKNPRKWYYALMDYGVMLKKSFPNPSRKSAHYQKQSRFAGSDRQIRGRIIKILLEEEKNGKEISTELSEDKERAERILSQMVKEKIIKRRNKKYYI